MRRAMLLATLAAVTALGACKKTGENEYEVKTPDVDVNVSTDSTKITTPDVDVGTKPDTLIVNRPTIDVNNPNTKTDTGTKKRP